MKNNKSIMIFAIMILIFAFGIFYLSRRTAFALQIKPLALYFIYTLLIFFAIGMMMVGMYVKSTTPAVHYMHIAGNVLVGVLLYLLLSTICIDIIHIFAKFSPKVFGLAILCLTTIVSSYAIINAAHPRVNKVDIKIEKLKKPVKIVHLTDVHLGHFRGKENIDKIVKLTNAENPDFVVITGDLFESNYNLDASTLTPLKEIHAPIFFVDGNHDIYTNDMKVKELVAETGTCVLVNEMVETNGIQLIGLDYMNADIDSKEDAVPHEQKSETIRNVMPKFNINSSKPTIVLHHAPIGGKFIADAGADLFLAGHTHGGQLFPLTIINNYLFEFNKGLYNKYGMQVYVSCGTGTFGPPMRLGTKSEIAVLNLIP